MFDSLIVDVAIGLIFTFAVSAAITSAATEAIARYLGLRGDYLLRGLRSLVDGKAVPSGKPEAGTYAAKVLAGPLLASPGNQDLLPDISQGLDRTALRRVPSYISSTSFAASVIDLVIPNASGTTTFAELITGIDGLDDGILKKSLLALAKNANGRIEDFRALVEHWYDDHMSRVSGWYKRHTRWISLGVGAVIVIVFNVNAVTIARDLYTDQALRESVVTEALAKAKCAPEDVGGCISDARKEIATLSSDGLPVGWGTVAACRVADAKCNVFERHGLWSRGAGFAGGVTLLLGVIVGLLLSTLALTPGARFWFDLLGKLGSLRSSGPPPGTAA